MFHHNYLLHLIPVLLVRFQTDYFARMRASLRWGDLAERETLQ